MRTETRTRLLTAAVGAVLTVVAGCLALFRAGGCAGDAELRPALCCLIVPVLADDIRIVYLDAGDGGRSLTTRTGRSARQTARGGCAARYSTTLIFDRALEDPAVDEAFAAAMRRFRGVNALRRSHSRCSPATGAPGLRTDSDRPGRGYRREAHPADRSVFSTAADDFGLVLFAPTRTFTVRELATGTWMSPRSPGKWPSRSGPELDETGASIRAGSTTPARRRTRTIAIRPRFCSCSAQ